MSFLTLGIETSCDDTAIAVLEGSRDVRVSLLASQTADHAPYGGVVPEIASRKHQEAILPLLRQVLKQASVVDPAGQIGLIAVTAGPGLMGSLLVGAMTAKGLAQAWDVPVMPVNHLEGHLYANVLIHPELAPPFVCAIVSGGHTELVLVREWGDYRLLGATRDDAAGEAYDKVAKLMGLGYPGGPIVDRLAVRGDALAVDFPIPLKGTRDVEFSFSGLKTAFLNELRARGMVGETLGEEDRRVWDLCAAFQRAVAESIVDKIELALKQTRVRAVALSGGVAANSALRARLTDRIQKRLGAGVFFPPPALCTDNAAMIAAAGYASMCRAREREKTFVSDLCFAPDPSWSLWNDE